MKLALRTRVKKAWQGGPVALFLWLRKVLARGFFAVVNWCAGLRLRLLLQGLPALVVGSVALVVLAQVAFVPAHQHEARYLERAQASSKAQNHAEALVCYERLADLGNDRPDVLFEMAVACEATGQPERCLLLMGRLAPVDRAGGYGKAHLWHAVRLLSRPSQTPQLRQLAETHLLRALEAGLDDREAAYGLLGELYFARGLFAQAETNLLIAVRTKPQVRVRLAHLYMAMGDKGRARSEAKIAINVFSAAAKADRTAHHARLRWAEAVTLIEDFPLAILILEEGFSGTREPVYLRAQASVYAVWCDFLSRDGSGSIGQRLSL